VDSHDTLIAPVRARTDRLGIPVHGARPLDPQPLDPGPSDPGPSDPGPLGPRSLGPRSSDRRGAPALGRYRLLERLGSGGFGDVWRAHDELLSREVAVKMISLPAGEDCERATREALATARLAHPAIVALYEACAEQDTFYLISELVHGDTLATVLAAEAPCDEQLLEIGIVLCDALLHAHRRGVIHRDIKPHNVLVPVGGDPVAKLTDFGGALLAGEEALTRTGDVLGTLAYMAPEQLDGEEVTAAADLYSLALVLYEGFSGVNPVRGPTPAATARRIGEPLPSLRRQRRDLPRALGWAIDRALDPDPLRRGTLPELREALIQGLRGDPLGPRWGRQAPPPHLIEERPGTAGWPPGTADWRPDTADRPPDTAGWRPGTAGWLTPARLAWLVAALAVCIWQLAAGRSGIALVVSCAVLPLVLLVRRPGVWWLAAALAPLLGLAGLACAFPALAGQPLHWRSRALLGALGYWWLRLALPLLENPSGAALARLHVGRLNLGLLLGLALWALSAALLPVLVRGLGALLDGAAAVAWAASLAVAVLLAGSLHRGLSISPAAPRDVLLGAALGAALAVVARALRGPV
jgi:hypothetical protein